MSGGIGGRGTGAMARPLGRGDKRRGMVQTRAAAFPTNPNPPDPIPGSHSTVGLPGTGTAWRPGMDLFNDPNFAPTLFGSGNITGSPGYWPPQPFTPPGRPFTPTPQRPLPVVPASPRPTMIAAPGLRRPRNPRRLPQGRALGYNRLSPSGNPFADALAATGGGNVYGGAGFNGGGGAWTGAMNDANSFSGGAPGIGSYTGPNPSPTDPDYGYTN